MRVKRVAWDTVAVLGGTWLLLMAVAYAYDFVAAPAPIGGGRINGDQPGVAQERDPRPPPLPVKSKGSVETGARHEVLNHNGDDGLELLADLERRTLDRIHESGRLTLAMCNWLTEVQGASSIQCERRQVEGLAHAIVETVDARHRLGLWVPLGRAKAPALLAAWSYHEVSWKWQRPPRGRSHGERGAFQFHGVAEGFVEAGYERNVEVAIEGAMNYMSYLSDLCNGSGWGGAYIAGTCGSNPREVGKRFNTARWLFRRMTEADEISQAQGTGP